MLPRNSESIPKTYLDHIEEAKRRLSIPVIASLNCTTLSGWLSYARRITDAGADALELNIYKIPTHTQISGSTIEKEYIDVVRRVRAATPIPLAVKLSPYFSNFANMADAFDALGVQGLVLFNRFYQPDIDIEKMEMTPNLNLSTPNDMRLPLHWIGILYGKIRANLAATSGVYQASRRRQTHHGRRGCDHALQRVDAPRHHPYSANPNGSCRLARSTQLRVVR